jgi:hypothetical protein
MPKIRKPFGSKDTETFRIRSKGPKICTETFRRPFGFKVSKDTRYGNLLDPKDTKTFWIDLVGAIFLAHHSYNTKLTMDSQINIFLDIQQIVCTYEVKVEGVEGLAAGLSPPSSAAV